MKKGVRGVDAYKKVKGRKRHIVVDTMGTVLDVRVSGANVLDRDGARELFGEDVKARYPRLSRLWADSAYAGGFVDFLGRAAQIEVQIIGGWASEPSHHWCLEDQLPAPRCKSATLHTIRWVVERTIAWLNRCRRLTKDYEQSIAAAEAWIQIAMIAILLRRLIS